MRLSYKMEELVEKQSSYCSKRSMALKFCIGIAIVCGLLPNWASAQTVASKDDLGVDVAVIDPHTLADIFGKRIAQRFIALQVTIRNKSSEHQFLIHDVSLDLEKVFPADYFAAIELQECQARLTACANWNAALDDAASKRDQRLDETAQERDKGLDAKARAKNKLLDDVVKARNQRRDDAAQRQCSCVKSTYELSSLELSLLRGVAEKGQSEDPRNKIFRFLQAFGTVAGALVGVAGFGPSYAGSIAVFNGPVLSAYSNTFPDYTVNQMNRLSDSAYKSNTLVPKQQAKVIVAFVAQSMFLNKRQRDLIWKDPTLLFNGSDGQKIDFRRTEAVVKGDFITEISNLPPLIVSAQFDNDEIKKFQADNPVVKGYLTGRFSPDVKINLLNQEPQGLSIKLDGTPSTSKLNFIIESTGPVPPDTLLIFEVANEQAVQTTSRLIHYKVDAPTITAIDPAEGARATESLSIEITGTNFTRGTTKVLISGTGVRVLSGSVEVAEGSSTTLTAQLVIDEDAPLGERRITVSNPTGGSAGFVTFTVKVAP